MSNSLKFTNKEGRVTVALKIVNQQACGGGEGVEGLKTALEKSQNKIIDKFVRRKKKSNNNLQNYQNMRGDSRKKSIFDINQEKVIENFKTNNDDSMVEFIKQKFISVSNKNSSNILA